MSHSIEVFIRARYAEIIDKHIINYFHIVNCTLRSPFITIIVILKHSLLLQNGYPSRRRSLVDDARFESAVVKQTKQAVLEEARLKANGEF